METRVHQCRWANRGKGKDGWALTKELRGPMGHRRAERGLRWRVTAQASGGAGERGSWEVERQVGNEWKPLAKSSMGAGVDCREHPN